MMDQEPRPMNQGPNRLDTLVVGAGPAGAWAAYSLARRGARVTIVDPSHPREKPCGGGVTGRAMALVAGAIAPIRSSTIQSARFLDSSRARSAVVALSGEGAPGLIVTDRATFDAALLDAACRAGATFVAARVSDINLNAGGVRVETTRGALQARFLIGADGANSLVRRRLAQPFDRGDLSIATGFFAHGVTSDEIVIELIDNPPGYIWSFPRPTHLAIGICAQADAGATAAALRERAAAWIRETRIAEGARLEPYSWPIPSLRASTLTHIEIAGRRWCTVGDAAGLVDPITREGIYFALQSGAWAADAATAGDAAPYAARVEAEIFPELCRAIRLKAGFFRLASTGLLMRALGDSPAVGRVMADLIEGRQGYRGLKWRLARTLEWGLAWDAIVSGRSSRLGRERERRAATP
jgi:geranylgeranyl reductase family protein